MGLPRGCAYVPTYPRTRTQQSRGVQLYFSIQAGLSKRLTFVLHAITFQRNGIGSSAYPFARPITADLHVLPKKPWGQAVSNEEYPPLFVWGSEGSGGNRTSFFLRRFFFQKIQHNPPYSITADNMAPPSAPPATTHKWKRTSMPAHVAFAPVLRAANPLIYLYSSAPAPRYLRGNRYLRFPTRCYRVRS